MLEKLEASTSLLELKIPLHSSAIQSGNAKLEESMNRSRTKYHRQYSQIKTKSSSQLANLGGTYQSSLDKAV